MLAVQILVQAVVVIWSVFEEKWRWFLLTRLVTALDVVGVRGWVADVDAHRFVPTISDWHQMRIERRAKTSNQIGQRITEVFILSTSEAMTLHHDLASKNLFVVIEVPNPVAFIGRHHSLNDRITLRIKVSINPLPRYSFGRHCRIIPFAVGHNTPILAFKPGHRSHKELATDYTDFINGFSS